MEYAVSFSKFISHKCFNTLEYLLSDRHIIDIVLGDFNIDILNSTNINLQNVLSNYTLLEFI